MQQDLQNVISLVRGNKGLLVVDEASVKAGVVLQIFQMLRWNPFDVSEVVPEYTAGGKRVDFALRVSSISKVFIEVKRPAEDLGPHQEQLLTYSFTEGVRLAVLTNGFTWWFYLPLSEGSWEQRRFYSLDLLEQEPADVAKRLEDFLSKDRVISGEAIISAEHVYKSKKTKAILRDSIPRAWNKILGDPDDLLVDLLIETTEKLCGFRPDITDIEKFLKSVSTELQIEHPDTSSLKRAVPRVTPVRQEATSIISRSRDFNFTGTKIKSFSLFGKAHYPKTWQELLLSVATEMYRRHPNNFDKCLSLRGSKMIYFSTNPNELSYPKQIANTNFYAEAKLNSNSIVRRSMELLALFGHSDADLQVRAE